jgi:uncharacterized protein (DUF433 family)
MNVDWRERIVIDQAIHYGEPCITATRVPASVIVGSIVDGDKPEQILVAYPQLTGDDLKAVSPSSMQQIYLGQQEMLFSTALSTLAFTPPGKKEVGQVIIVDSNVS